MPSQPPQDLSDLISRLAGNCTEADQRLLIDTVAGCRLGLRLVQYPTGMANGQQETVGPGLKVVAATVKGPGGVQMLVAYADAPARHRAEPELALGEVDGPAALRMAISGGLGGILIYGPGDAWACITTEGVAQALAGQDIQPEADEGPP